MPKRLTKEKLIEKARDVHGDKYDYTKSTYKNLTEKVCITCKYHGDFLQTPVAHIYQGQGCPICSRISNANKKRGNIEEFIEKANNIHHSKYDYTESVYTNCDTKIKIKCPIHGYFYQTPYNHLNKEEDCPKCKYVKLWDTRGDRINTGVFKELAYRLHGDKYDYSKSYCRVGTDKVVIICKKHGEFIQTAQKHLYGQCCPYCKSYKLEELIADELTKNGIKYIRQYRAKWLGLQSLDFFIPISNILTRIVNIQILKDLM